jgi:hypothetical protein
VQKYTSVKIIKDLDQRHITHGGGVIRVETWIDPKTDDVVSYNLSYINKSLFNKDNGRMLGFDNAHMYPDFPSLHHEHHLGQVEPNLTFTNFSDLLDRFQTELGNLKKIYGKRY